MMERIKVSEMKEVLSAVDVIGDDEKEKEKFLAGINLDPNGTVSFDELKQMLSQKVQYKIQAGRYYVSTHPTAIAIRNNADNVRSAQ